MERIGLYAKAIAGAAGTGLTAAITALTDGNITNFEWTVIAVATLTALAGVWAIPQTPAWVATYGKAVFAGLISVAASIGNAVYDGSGINQGEWLGVAVALLTGLGVYVTSNAASSDPVGADGKLVAIGSDVKEEIVAPGPTTVQVEGDEVVAVG